MRVLILAAALAGASTAAFAQNSFTYGTGSNSNSHYVRPHYNSNSGNYTGGHYRTNPDSSRSNNYGAYGNYNRHDGGIGDGYGRSRNRW